MSNQKRKVGIIICDRYSTCAGGKCFKALKNREGAFSVYENREVELAGYTTCGGCPGGNVEYCVKEMKKNGVEVVHLATGFVVGYPPCPYINHFCSVIKQKYGVDVIIGTHPIPRSYYVTHQALGTWNSPEWKEKIKHVLTDEQTRLKYNQILKEHFNGQHALRILHSLSDCEKMMQTIIKVRELNEEIRNCRKCGLWLTRKCALPGEGNISSKLVLIAQAPGYTEDKEGRMFVGPSGKKLDELFVEVGIDRLQIFITNILRCMLPNYRKPRQNEIDACTPYLDKEIELINPKIIGTLGYVAAKYIFKQFNIDNELKFPDVCGEIFSVKDKKIISLRHPAALLYNDSLYKEMVKNYGKLRILLDSV